MADKIVQLQNENGDNIYPLSRGLAADSVDTAAIKDEAITSDKIDWSTIYTSAEYSGSNNSNTYTLKEFKYADGTMELWGTIDFGALVAKTVDAITITYPTAFASAPVVVVGLLTGSTAWSLGNFSVAYVPDNLTNQAVFRCYNGSTENRNGSAAFCIRGRWK